MRLGMSPHPHRRLPSGGIHGILPAFVLATALQMMGADLSSAMRAGDWVLLWKDDFNSGTLDPSRWRATQESAWRTGNIRIAEGVALVESIR